LRVALLEYFKDLLVAVTAVESDLAFFLDYRKRLLPISLPARRLTCIYHNRQKHSGHRTPRNKTRKSEIRISKSETNFTAVKSQTRKIQNTESSFSSF